MWLLVGLGNPGKDYDRTRHNIGFDIVDAAVSLYGLDGWRTKFHGEMATGSITGQKVIVLKPQTYMNKSGVAVGEVANFYKIPPENIIVIHDELDLAVGKMRIKRGGGAGGHNGLKSIDQHVGQNYHRVRVGIAHPGNAHQVSNYVLKPFSSEDRVVVDKISESIAKHLPEMLLEKADKMMNKVALDMAPPKPKKEVKETKEETN